MENLTREMVFSIVEGFTVPDSWSYDENLSPEENLINFIYEYGHECFLNGSHN